MNINKPCRQPRLVLFSGIVATIIAFFCFSIVRNYLENDRLYRYLSIESVNEIELSFGLPRYVYFFPYDGMGSDQFSPHVSVDGVEVRAYLFSESPPKFLMVAVKTGESAILEIRFVDS